MRRATATTIALCMLALPIVACGDDDEPSAATTPTAAAVRFPTTIDNCGTKADVFQQPRKILAVSTAAQKLIYGAGGAGFVIARAGEDAGPPPAPVVAAMKNAELLPADTLSKEAIIGTGADTVISYGIETKGCPRRRSRTSRSPQAAASSSARARARSRSTRSTETSSSSGASSAPSSRRRTPWPT